MPNMTISNYQLTSRVTSRKQAYSFITKKIKKLKLSDYYRLNKTTYNLDYISLSDLTELKKGTSDPAPQLVVNLKNLLLGTVSEAEIDKYLIQPFKEQVSEKPSIETDR
ncbi:MAG: hypothetical protein JSV32_03250 [Dehalococcoidia bacterium]|nr:MAG: hypothetical protein JSV32_03250 [Dehalococcoidia bacterium]